MIKYVIGVDEVGRGPLAGPVAVGAVCIPIEFDWSVLPGVTDSKKLTEKKREAIYQIAQDLQKKGMIDFKVSMVSAKVIDNTSITKAIHTAINRSISRLNLTNFSSEGECLVKLDGGLQAPATFTNQVTIVKGDIHEKEIGLAPIVGKVTRDRYMSRIAKRYTLYDFEVHKGYGTKHHRNIISIYGLSDIHRKSFCTRVINHLEEEKIL